MQLLFNKLSNFVLILSGLEKLNNLKFILFYLSVSIHYKFSKIPRNNLHPLFRVHLFGIRPEESVDFVRFGTIGRDFGKQFEPTSELLVEYLFYVLIITINLNNKSKFQIFYQLIFKYSSNFIKVIFKNIL